MKIWIVAVQPSEDEKALAAQGLRAQLYTLRAQTLGAELIARLGSRYPVADAGTTRRWTAFPSFACLLASRQQAGEAVATSYWPSLYPGRHHTPVEVAEVRALADAYDAAQTERGDPRRACRGCVSDWSPPCC